MARIELSNIGGGGGTALSLTTTGTSGAATLAGSVLNIPVYQGQLTLTTTGTSGAATLVGNTLNIPQYSGGGGTPAGSTGQIQYNNAGAFAASANLAWDNANVRLNIGAPSAPTGRLNVKGGGTTSSTVNLRLTDSGNTELIKVLDNGNTNIGTVFNWDNTNGRLGLGTSSPQYPFHIVTSSRFGFFYECTDGTLNQNYIFYYRNSPTPANNDYLGALTFQGNNSSLAASTYAYFGARITNVTAGSHSGELYFATTNSTVESDKMLIKANGNILIGTTTNTARLQVRGEGITSSTVALLIQNNSPSDLFQVRNDGKITYWATNTAAGTTGPQTIDRPSGTVNFAAGATALVVTNSLCTANSIIFATVRTNDATAYIKNVVPAALGGSFTINLGAAATAETSVGFFIIN